MGPVGRAGAAGVLVNVLDAVLVVVAVLAA